MKQKPDMSAAKAKIAGDNAILKCGQCMHFRGSAHPSIGTPCQTSGVKPYAIAPDCYTPDVHQLKAISPESYATLATIVASCKPQQAMILMGMFKGHATLKRRTNFSLMEKVYFAIGTGEFLSDYFAGFALGMAPHEKVLIVGTQYFSNQRSSVVASMDAKSILSREAFQKRVSRLVKTGKLAPPRERFKMEVPPDIAKYEPPTIESSQELLEATAGGTPKPKRKAKVLTIRDQS